VCVNLVVIKKRKISPPSTASPPPQTVPSAKPHNFLNSANKPLPGFTKRKAAAQAEASSNVSPAIDPFSEAMKHLGKAKTPPVVASGTVAAATTSSVPNQFKKRKRVSWAPDGELEKIKVVERISYGDEDTEVAKLHLVLWIKMSELTVKFQGGHTLREMEMGEGAALHLHAVDLSEEIEWYTPTGSSFLGGLGRRL
jgi:protein phosphatase 1 regulatory subunit 10